MFWFLGHLKTAGDLLRSIFVCRRPLYVVHKQFDFSSETTGQILIKLGHNDHLVVGIIIYTCKGFDPEEAEGRDQMGSNSAKSSNDFSSEPLLKF